MDMQENENIVDLRTRLAGLEAELLRLEKRRKAWRWSVFAMAVIGISISLMAQSAQGPVTLQSLAKRVTDLENRVTADEASGTNIPQTADNGSSPSTGKSSSSSSGELAALQKRVSTLESSVDYLVQTRSPDTLLAPFKVLGKDGKPVLTVTEEDGGGALRLFGAGGTSALIGSPHGQFGIRLYPANASRPAAAMIIDPQGIPTIGVASNGKWRATMQIVSDQGHIGVKGSQSDAYLAALTSYPGGGGALQIALPSAQVVSLVDANPANNEGRAVFTNTGGQPLAKIGAAGSHGDVLIGGNGKAFELWGRMVAGLP
jgi:hypothetical protein